MDKVTSNKVHIVCEGAEAARVGDAISDCPYTGADRQIWIESFLSVVASRLHQIFPRSIIRVACAS
jgi:hypothetical protein